MQAVCQMSARSFCQRVHSGLKTAVELLHTNTHACTGLPRLEIRNPGAMQGKVKIRHQQYS